MPETSRQTIDLALQGGGSHGAFTWGVLDRLMEDGSLDPAGISGASAGAMNAVVLAAGLTEGGPAEARARLRSFWEAVNASAETANPALSVLEAFPGYFRALDHWWSHLSRGQVQVQLDPAAGRPAQLLLGEVLAAHVDFGALQAPEAPRLFISATEARSGRLRIFRNGDLSLEAVLASACLPMSFPPVVIDGEEYWDGGYVANPPLMPLIAESPCDDLLLVTLNPLLREETPTDLPGITARISDLTFNQSLLRDMRTIGLSKSMLAETLALSAPPLVRALRRLRLHEIHGEDELGQMDPRSKMVPGRKLLARLHAAGRDAAGAWLSGPRAWVGHQSTADLAERYALDE